MPFAINIKATNATAAPLLTLQSEFRRLKAASTAAMSDYPPHLTFAIYDDVSTEELRGAMHRVFSRQRAFTLRFCRVATFEHPQLVFWAAPEPSKALTQVHTAVHELIDPTLCHEHYRPLHWVPHCTLAMNVPAERVSVARQIAARSLQPFDVTFEAADCVEFHPIRIIDACALSSN